MRFGGTYFEGVVRETMVVAGFVEHGVDVRVLVQKQGRRFRGKVDVL